MIELKTRPRIYTLPETRNWGDIFGAYLLKHGFDVEMSSSECDKGDIDRDMELRNGAEVFSCGSLLERVPDGFSGHILGSGMGYAETRRDLTNVKYPLLLRGPLTAERCSCISYSCPVPLGDPGILADMFVRKDVERFHPRGIVPHVVDKHDARVQCCGAFVIDIESGVENVINAIASCEKIVSSCLHGLVIADSLGVPCKYVRLSNLVGNFKFQDYYALYGEAAEPASNVEEAFAVCRTRDVSSVKEDVLAVFTEYVERLV